MVVFSPLLFKGRVVVPAAGRSATLVNLHGTHQGQTNMLARSQVWWPWLSKDIAATWAACAKCSQEAPSQSSAASGSGGQVLQLVFGLQAHTLDGATVFTGHVFEEFCKTWGCGTESPQLIIPIPTSRQRWQSGQSRGSRLTATGPGAVWTQTPLLQPCCSKGRLPADSSE